MASTNGASGGIRNKHQSMGLWLNEGILSEPHKVVDAVDDLAQAGYDVVRIFLRWTNFNHRSPEVVQAVARIVERAHQKGMRAVLDCEPHHEPVGRDMGVVCPDGIGSLIVRCEGAVVDGNFTLRVPNPMSGQRADFKGIEAAFLRQGSSVRPVANLPFAHRMAEEPYQDDFTTGDSAYVQGRPMWRKVYLHLTGRLEGVGDGRLIAYVRFVNPRTPDFWSEGFGRYYELLLECYRDIPLDGVGWDEPGAGVNWSQYLYGAGVAKAFERLNGYSLKEKWYLLDEPGISAESVKVRLDYYRTLNEGLFEAQRRLIQKSRELFGRHLILGTHHTWQGEAGINDYRAGAVDYFRLNDNMDAGYTDGWWWDIKSISYAYTLGSSLGRLTVSGECEANTWDMKPTNSRVGWYSRLMTLLDIVWFNIWYGETGDVQVFPSDYTWKRTIREMRRHREAQRVIAKARPITDVAILHGWETACGVNREDIASAHKAFCLNTAQLFVDRSVAFDWVDTRLLAESRIEGGRLVNALGSYGVLVMPYATILPRAAWAKCVEFARAGGKVVFTGPPVEMDTDGRALGREFAELLQMPELSLSGYLARIATRCTLPAYRADRLDVSYPLDGDKGRILTSVEDEPHGIRNVQGNVIYLSDLDPRQRLLGIVESWISPEVVCHSDSILWRLYGDGERSILVCIARQDRELRGVIRWGKEELELHSGEVALIVKQDATLRVIGEGVKWSRRS